MEDKSEKTLTSTGYEEILEFAHKEIKENYKNIKDFCDRNHIKNYNGIIKMLNGFEYPKKIIEVMSLLGYDVQERKTFTVKKK